MDVVPDVLVECETRRSACHHSTLRPPAKSPLTCLNTQIHSKEGIQPFTKLHNLSIRNDMNQSETTTNRKVISHLVRKQHINCHFMFFFLLFLVFFGFFFTVFCTFLFSDKFVFGFFLVIHQFCLVLRFLFNCFWSWDLGTGGL